MFPFQYDHKSQGMGKRKVELKISVDGVKVSSANGANQRHNFGRVDYDKLDNLISFDADSSNTLLQHPIHRYLLKSVSHVFSMRPLRIRGADKSISGLDSK